MSRDNEPFLLLRTRDQEKAVTNEMLSEQLGALSVHLGVVHKEVALARGEAKDARAEAQAAREAAEHASGAVSELRSLVLGDHAPRISKVQSKLEEVSERTRKLSVSPAVKKWTVRGGALGGAAMLWPIIEALLPLVKQLVKQ